MVNNFLIKASVATLILLELFPSAYNPMKQIMEQQVLSSLDGSVQKSKNSQNVFSRKIFNVPANLVQ